MSGDEVQRLGAFWIYPLNVRDDGGCFFRIIVDQLSQGWR